MPGFFYIYQEFLCIFRAIISIFTSNLLFNTILYISLNPKMIIIRALIPHPKLPNCRANHLLAATSLIAHVTPAPSPKLRILRCSGGCGMTFGMQVDWSHDIGRVAPGVSDMTGVVAITLVMSCHHTGRVVPITQLMSCQPHRPRHSPNHMSTPPSAPRPSPHDLRLDSRLVFFWIDIFPRTN